MSGEVTIWELSRRIDRMDSRIESGFTKLEASISALQFVPMNLYISERKATDARLTELEDKNKWLTRLTVSSVIGAMTSLTVLFIAARGGL